MSTLHAAIRDTGRHLFALMAALAVVSSLAPAAGGQARAIVYVAPIEGMIDMGLAPFVRRVLADAERDSASAVILEINTFGGRLDAAVLIRDALLSSPIQSVAFINRRAISAGALISLASNRIAIADGATIGAATPVQAGDPSGGAKPVEEKTVSYVRKEFRATAESRKRPILVAEAMVDSDVEISGLIEKGKLLTLSGDEAMQHGMADFRASTVAGVLEELGLSGAEIRRSSPNWAEQIVRLLTHPVLSSLLLSLGMLGILMEIRTPGFGIPGAVGLTSLALFMGGHWIVELAGWEEMMLVAIGLILITVEVFVVPGFGITGILGIGAVLAGLTLSLFGAGATGTFVVEAVGRVAFSMIVAIIGSLVLLQLLKQTPVGRGLVLDTGMGTREGWASAPESDTAWLGRTGRTQSMLRPAGIADIEGTRVDVVSDGEMIEAGADVKVVRVDGNRVVVRRHRT